jgi:hypothetical protein
MAHTSDGKVYYYHTETKLTKWDLSKEEIGDLMSDMKYVFTDKSGYAWKRSPRSTDNDAPQKRQMRAVKELIPSFARNPWRRRWFMFTHTDKILRYYPNHLEGVETEKGQIDLNDIQSVNVVDELNDSSSPTHFHINIQTTNRKWHFCVDNGTEQTMWNAVFQYIIHLNQALVVKGGATVLGGGEIGAAGAAEDHSDSETEEDVLNNQAAEMCLPNSNPNADADVPAPPRATPEPIANRKMSRRLSLGDTNAAKLVEQKQAAEAKKEEQEKEDYHSDVDAGAGDKSDDDAAVPAVHAVTEGTTVRRLSKRVSLNCDDSIAAHKERLSSGLGGNGNGNADDHHSDSDHENTPEAHQVTVGTTERRLTKRVSLLDDNNVEHHKSVTKRMSSAGLNTEAAAIIAAEVEKEEKEAAEAAKKAAETTDSQQSTEKPKFSLNRAGGGGGAGAGAASAAGDTPPKPPGPPPSTSENSTPPPPSTAKGAAKNALLAGLRSGALEKAVSTMEVNGIPPAPQMPMSPSPGPPPRKDNAE